MPVNVFHDVIRRIKPYVGVQGYIRLNAHALIAYKYKETKAEPVICVRDPNVVIEGVPYENCQNQLYLVGDSVHYPQQGVDQDEELSSITLQTDEDQRTRGYITAHSEWCKKNSTTSPLASTKL